jgi:hypothetical protein
MGSVFASAAKQSGIFRWRQLGLLGRKSSAHDGAIAPLQADRFLNKLVG